jgi:hypothetical protein
MKFLAIATLSICFGASLASANCSDEVLADCGGFTINSTVCPIFSDSGELQGATQFYTALYTDMSEIPPMLGPSVELNRVEPPAGSSDDVYSASLTNETKVFVTVSSKKGLHQNTELTYSTYMTSRGRKSSVEQCASTPTE